LSNLKSKLLLMERSPPVETQTKQRERRSSMSDEAEEDMDTQRKRRGVASWIDAERRIYSKSTEFTCTYWSEKKFVLKLALTIILGMTVLLLPQYLTFSSTLPQRLIEASLLASGGTSFVAAYHPYSVSQSFSILQGDYSITDLYRLNIDRS
jgi:hypothetical protein